jgi:hypothetical protein
MALKGGCQLVTVPKENPYEARQQMLPYIIFREHIIEVWEDPESHTGFQ